MFPVVLLLVAVSSASGQGFAVKPMRLEPSPRPGEEVRMAVEVRNSEPVARVLEVELVDLFQDESGSWRIIGADSDFDRSTISSARGWTTIDADEVELGPLGMVELPVTVRAPAGARGFHAAGLLVRSRPPEGAGGVRVVVQFLIPVLVDIQGRPERQNIRLQDVVLESPVNEDDQHGTTRTALILENEGRTFSRVSGSIRIARIDETRRRHVASVDVRERSMLPGTRFRLDSDLGRRLPSGEYHLTGTLYVDGRRLAPLNQEVDFQGDPSAASLAVDRALILDPEMLTLNVSPGATRTTVIRVENPSDEPIDVHAAVATPEALQGVTLGELRGEALSAAPWLEIQPERFTLRPNARQNVRVISRIPREEIDHAHYYGQLVLNATYQDGQSAGFTTSMAHLANSRVADQPRGQLERLSLATDSEGTSHYVLSTRFVNLGNVHLEPTAEAMVVTSLGAVANARLTTGERGTLLPLGRRPFAGTLDFGGVEPGYYALRVVADLGEGTAVEQVPIHVDLNSDGSRSVTIVDADDPEVPDLDDLPATDADTEAASQPADDLEGEL